MFALQLVSAGIILSLAGACRAAPPAVPVCPAEIQFSAASHIDLPEGWGFKPPCTGTACIDPLRLIEVPSGWNATISPGKLHLLGIGFSSGPPNEMAILKPDSVETRSGVSYEKTLFEDGTAVRRGWWVSCFYAGSVFELSRQLPDGLKQCTVTYPRRSNGDPRKISMTCK